MYSFREPCPKMLGFTTVELLMTIVLLAVLTGIALPSYSAYVDRARNKRAQTDILTMQLRITRFFTDQSRYPDDLSEIGAVPTDPWGSPYQYLNITTVKGKGAVRKDKHLNPLNSDFDLYSIGKDGDSKPPLSAKASKDDTLRARDGSFVGLGADF